MCERSGYWDLSQGKCALSLMGLFAGTLLLSAPRCTPPPEPKPPLPDMREPCENVDPLRQPFFGDLHVHTSSSLDANLQGTRLGPSSAYDFAQGATVDIQPYDEQGNGLRTLTIDRPLDFAMVSDHAEFFGEISICTERDPPPEDENDPYYSKSCEYFRTDPDFAFLRFNAGLGFFFRSPDVCGNDWQDCVDQSITLWDEIQDAAEDAYDRTSECSFTSFVGYEWTGSPAAWNLHRNVLFRTRTVPENATSYFEAGHPELLWSALEDDCQADENPNTPDCEFLTIPHNSNLSAGTYFAPFDQVGDTYNQITAARRRLHEPIAEVIQHKGQSECIPGSSPNDELCDFEVLPYNKLSDPVRNTTGVPQPQDFLREVLKQGLSIEKNLGVNPFKYGLVGGTDTHLATPGAVSEKGYPGHGGAGAPARAEIPPGLVDDPNFNPGGLTVIWAEENSRDSLFDALRRREVYATSGTRPVVRFFGTLNGMFNLADLCNHPDPISVAYQHGVPMGSTISSTFPGNVPSLFVSALKDPGTEGVPGTDLQRIQIVKGWVDPNGESHEMVYDVVGDANKQATVDLDTCEPVGTGFDELCAVWDDPDFSYNQHAFYYARVVENPTCRWHKHQCTAGGVDCEDPETITQGFQACCDDSLPDTVQERAWTSPIWYQPVDLDPRFVLGGSNLESRICRGGSPWEITVNTNQMYGFLNPVTLSMENLPPGVTASFSQNPVTAPGQSVIQLSADASAIYYFSYARIRGTANEAPDQTLSFPFRTYDQVPSAPVLAAPADGADDEGLLPLFRWSFGTQTLSQVFELSQDPTFNTIDVSETAQDTIMVLQDTLLPYTTYYWRVRPENPCGVGEESTVFSFTTGAGVVVAPPVTDIPIPGST